MAAALRMIKALVVDDSAYNRVTITRLLKSDPRIEVVGSAVNGEDAIKQLMKHLPDVVILDLEMPVMDGYSFLRWVMHNRPTAVIVVSSRTSDRSVFKALELGAVDFIAKPAVRVSPRLEEIQRDLLAKIIHVAEVRLDNLARRAEVEEDPPIAPEAPECAGDMQIVTIGSSTGGPPALQHLFQSLPILPLPIVVAQHMPATFTRLFAERVNRLTQYEVKEAEDGDVLSPGCAYIAPGGMQTQVVRHDGALHARVSKADPGDLYAPSVDRLFTSASRAARARMVGIILTGMGDDGAAGTRAVRNGGGKTIAESSDTAIIFGMPNEAIKTGCVDEVLALHEIAGAIERLCTTGS